MKKIVLKALPAMIVGAVFAAACSGCQTPVKTADVEKGVDIVCAELATLKAKGVQLPSELDEYLTVLCKVVSPDAG